MMEINNELSTIDNWVLQWGHITGLDGLKGAWVVTDELLPYDNFVNNSSLLSF